MIDNGTGLVTASSEAEFLESPAAGAAEVNAIYARCAEAYPDFGLSPADFRDAVSFAISKYLIGFAAESRTPSASDVRRFISGLQALDLYIALACARGNEHAWWEFDRQHRSFIERWARHLARSGADADEIIDSIYVELFGTKIVGGVRQSKFRTYTGRGSLRGWLRAIILHSAVDLYRTRKAEISLEDWSRGDDEGPRREVTSATEQRTEELMLAKVVRERYRSATMAALDQALTALDDRENLLLLYYHVEGLKLREIARIVEEPQSPIRRWFQRRSKRRAGSPPGRVHESTIMRWLERVYQKVSDRFHAELSGKHGLSAAEIEICKAIATEDRAEGLRLVRVAPEDESVNQKSAVERRRADAAPVR